MDQSFAAGVAAYPQTLRPTPRSPAPKPGAQRRERSPQRSELRAALRLASSPRPGSRRRSASPNRLRLRHGVAERSATLRDNAGFYWLETSPEPLHLPQRPRTQASESRRTERQHFRGGGGGELPQSSYAARQQLKSTWNTSVASAELLADAARMEAEAWALQEHDKATLTKEQLLWARRVDRQVVQSENHRLAEKVVNLTDALLRERSEAQAELESVRRRLDDAEEDAQISRVAARLTMRGGLAAEAAGLMWR